MEDGLRQLIKDVIQKLNDLRYEDTTKVFRHVNLYNNQINRLGRQNDYSTDQISKNIAPVFDFPAAFIEPVIDGINTQGLGTQIIQGRLIIHIALNRYDLDTNWELPLDIGARVHQALHLLKSSDDRYATLTRELGQPDIDHDNVFVWLQTYRYLAVDETANIYRGLPTAGTNANITAIYKVDSRIVKSV